jgi:hypothetical protein
MADLVKYWAAKLREAEQELDAATRRSDVDAAASRLLYAKAQLRAAKAVAKNPKRPASRVRAQAARS